MHKMTSQTGNRAPKKSVSPEDRADSRIALLSQEYAEYSRKLAWLLENFRAHCEAISS